MDGRLSYGFVLGADNLLAPYSEMTYGNSNRYRLGVRWQEAAQFNVNMYGERHEGTDIQTENTILLEARMQL